MGGFFGFWCTSIALTGTAAEHTVNQSALGAMVSLLLLPHERNTPSSTHPNTQTKSRVDHERILSSHRALFFLSTPVKGLAELQVTHSTDGPEEDRCWARGPTGHAREDVLGGRHLADHGGGCVPAVHVLLSLEREESGE